MDDGVHNDATAFVPAAAAAFAALRLVAASSEACNRSMAARGMVALYVFALSCVFVSSLVSTVLRWLWYSELTRFCRYDAHAFDHRLRLAAASTQQLTKREEVK